MGEYDSSLTRVQPVFEILLNQDPSGKSWLPILLDLSKKTSGHSKAFLGSVGNILPKDEGYFEIPVPPPEHFLTWLVNNPDKMKWPLRRGKRKEFGPGTQSWREKLFGLHGKESQIKAIQEALHNIKTKGAINSRRKWWAFEGFTTVDCCLETNELLLFIEGKRKDVLSPSTEWFAGRNQLSRNLEACKELADGKNYGVMLLCENQINMAILLENIKVGCPHLSKDEKSQLVSHFLGFVLWKDLCLATNIEYSKLPDSIF
jgi:hypothetical protein